MKLKQVALGWEVTVPCKLNLGLEILGKRGDGYHELTTTMLAVDLCDILRFTAKETSDITMEMSLDSQYNVSKLTESDPAWDIPTDNRNLVVKALEEVRRHLGISRGIDVHLRKSILAQAGLGGGSADAAAAVVGGMLAWTGSVDMQLASSIAASLGSDVNFFLEAGVQGGWLATCTGRGESINPIPTNWPLHLVIVHPPQGCSTKEVFSHLNATDSIARSASRNALHVMTAQAFRDRDLKALGTLLSNGLTIAAKEVNPWIDLILDQLSNDNNVVGVNMTGSGSACYALVPNAEVACHLARSIALTMNVRAYSASSWNAADIQQQVSLLLSN